MAEHNSHQQRPVSTDLPIAEHSTSSVPVFDCHVIVSRDDVQGVVTARVSRLPTISAQAATERDALRKIVEQFKQEMQKHHNSGTPVSWVDPPEKPGPGEAERWIPVHL